MQRRDERKEEEAKLWKRRVEEGRAERGDSKVKDEKGESGNGTVDTERDNAVTQRGLLYLPGSSLSWTVLRLAAKGKLTKCPVKHDIN